MPAQLDFIKSGNSGISASGNVATRLLSSNFDINALRTNDVLRKDEWIHFDSALVPVARQRLVGVADLMSRGLKYSLPNAMGKTRLEWEEISDMDPAEISMSGVTPGRNDRADFDLASMPIPIIHKGFNLNIRALAASRDTGQPLDTTQAELATRLVAERIEGLLFSGVTISASNGNIDGYTTAVHRNTGSVTASWVSASGTQILGDLLSMLGVMDSNNMFGPYVLYIPRAVYVHLGDDFKTNSDVTIEERLKKIPEISAILPSSNLTGSNVILAQMTSDVVRMVDGIQPTIVHWETQGGMVLNFKIIAIMVPQIRQDYQNNSGIVHFS